MAEPKVDYVGLTGVLFVICFLCTGALVGLDAVTRPIIDKQKVERELRARKAVLPAGTEKVDGDSESLTLDLAADWAANGGELEKVLGEADEKARKTHLFRGYDGAGKVTGYAAVCELPDGYSGTMTFMAGLVYDSALDQFKVASAKVTGHKETPGLGANIDQVKYAETVAAAKEHRDPVPWFLAAFKDRTADKLALRKGGPADGIEALTAATITSKAFTAAMKRVVEMFNRNKAAILAAGGRG